MRENNNQNEDGKSKRSDADQNVDQVYSWTLIVGLLLSAVSIVIVLS